MLWGEEAICEGSWALMAQAHKAEWLSSFLLASVPQSGSLSLATNFQVYLTLWAAQRTDGLSGH